MKKTILGAVLGAVFSLLIGMYLVQYEDNYRDDDDTFPVTTYPSYVETTASWDTEISAMPTPTQPPILPTNLLDRDYFTQDWAFVQVNEKDNTGQTYTKALYGDNGSITYLLNGEYHYLTAVAFVRYDNRSSQKRHLIMIYGDDRLLYTSQELTSGVEPEALTVDIEGVHQLKFVFQRTSESTPGWSYSDVALGDIFLE